MICFSFTENDVAIPARTILTPKGVEDRCAHNGFSAGRGCDGKSWFPPTLIYVGF